LSKRDGEAHSQAWCEFGQWVLGLFSVSCLQGHAPGLIWGEQHQRTRMILHCRTTLPGFI